MMPSLHYRDSLSPKSGRHPYYIVSPRYVRTSAGIRGLYTLCHWLNMTGQSAFMLVYPQWEGLATNPEMLAPVLTKEIIDYHYQTNVTPIVLYPEVTSGNIFNAPLSVRWFGNYAGLLGGDTVFDDNDIFFSHSKALAKETPSPDNVLTVPVIDTSVFTPWPKVERSGSCYYAGKFKAVYGGEVFGLPPDCVEITRDRSDQQSPTEIADLFRRSELFYCFEDTALANEAALCGCPTVLMPSDFFRWPLAIDEVGWDGYAWGDSADEVKRARTTVSRAYDNYVRNIPNFFRQLEHFVLVTQHRAHSTPYMRPVELPHVREDFSVQTTSKLRLALCDALLEIAQLKGRTELNRAYWTPTIDAATASDRVRFIEGFTLSLGEGASFSKDSATMLLIPPNDASTANIHLRVERSRTSAIVDVRLDDANYRTLLLDAAGETTETVVSIPVIEPGRPLAVSFAVHTTQVSSYIAVPRNRAKAAGMPRITVVGISTQSAADKAAMTDGGELRRGQSLNLLKGQRILAASNCTLSTNEDGFTCKGEAFDPQVVLSLGRSIGGQTSDVYIWGVYTINQRERLQFFAPDVASGNYGEALSAVVQLEPGTHLFVQKLPTEGPISSLRIDPTDGPAVLTFHHLALQVQEVRSTSSPIVEPSRDLPRVLARHDRYPLMSTLSMTAIDAKLSQEGELIKIICQSGDARVIGMALRPIIVQPGHRAYLYVRYSINIKAMMTVTVQTEQRHEENSIILQPGARHFMMPLPIFGAVSQMELHFGGTSPIVEIYDADILVSRHSEFVQDRTSYDLG
jgi:hypothetical protein